MRKRARQAKKREINEELLATIYNLQNEWQKLHTIIENSIEPVDHLIYQKEMAQIKYMYLLKEARQRNVRAVKYT